MSSSLSNGPPVVVRSWWRTSPAFRQKFSFLVALCDLSFYPMVRVYAIWSYWLCRCAVSPWWFRLTPPGVCVVMCRWCWCTWGFVFEQSPWYRSWDDLLIKQFCLSMTPTLNLPRWCLVLYDSCLVWLYWTWLGAVTHWALRELAKPCMPHIFCSYLFHIHKNMEKI